MVLFAFALLCAGALIGCVLAIRYLQGEAANAAVRVLHSALGAASLILLLVALGRGLPQTGMGMAGFASTAAILLGLALVFGVAIALGGWRRRRPQDLLVGTHAALAVAGFVLLLALVALG